MKAKVPYVKWRDGRPRFEPGPALRRRGVRGVDLRHPDGTWFLLHECMEYSTAVTTRAQIAKASVVPVLDHNQRRPYKRKLPNRSGDEFVYFLRSGDHIKIGFSRDPLRRLSNLKTAAPLGISWFAMVRGAQADEARLHEELKAHRGSGEWFVANEEVLAVLNRLISEDRDAA